MGKRQGKRIRGGEGMGNREGERRGIVRNSKGGKGGRKNIMGKEGSGGIWGKGEGRGKYEEGAGRKGEGGEAKEDGGRGRTEMGGGGRKEGEEGEGDICRERNQKECRRSLSSCCGVGLRLAVSVLFASSLLLFRPLSSSLSPSLA